MKPFSSVVLITMLCLGGLAATPRAAPLNAVGVLSVEVKGGAGLDSKDDATLANDMTFGLQKRLAEAGVVVAESDGQATKGDLSKWRLRGEISRLEARGHYVWQVRLEHLEENLGRSRGAGEAPLLRQWVGLALTRQALSMYRGRSGLDRGGVMGEITKRVVSALEEFETRPGARLLRDLAAAAAPATGGEVVGVVAASPPALRFTVRTGEAGQLWVVADATRGLSVLPRSGRKVKAGGAVEFALPAGAREVWMVLRAGETPAHSAPDKRGPLGDAFASVIEMRPGYGDAPTPVLKLLDAVYQQNGARWFVRRLALPKAAPSKRMVTGDPDSGPRRLSPETPLVAPLDSEGEVRPLPPPLLSKPRPPQNANASPILPPTLSVRRSYLELAAERTFKEGCYKDAVIFLRPLAEHGDARAAAMLGECLHNRRETREEALSWYQAAARQNDAMGLLRLAWCLEHGKGTEASAVLAQNYYARAVPLLQAQAEDSDWLAQWQLGSHLFERAATQDDYALALGWLRRAAAQGSASAMNGIGLCLAGGLGVATDEAEAVKYFRRAAVLGLASAQFNLADCYKQGRGVARDPGSADKWFHVAAAQGYILAQSARRTPSPSAFPPLSEPLHHDHDPN